MNLPKLVLRTKLPNVWFGWTDSETGDLYDTDGNLVLRGDYSEMPEAALPTDPQDRKDIPLATGCLDYFTAALAEVARVSKAGNDQHNPGQPLHWARGKSNDHPDCINRHLADRGTRDTDGQRHSAKLAWRALALLQEELEAEGAPPSRASRFPEDEEDEDAYRYGDWVNTMASTACSVADPEYLQKEKWLVCLEATKPENWVRVYFRDQGHPLPKDLNRPHHVWLQAARKIRDDLAEDPELKRARDQEICDKLLFPPLEAKKITLHNGVPEEWYVRGEQTTPEEFVRSYFRGEHGKELVPGDIMEHWEWLRIARQIMCGRNARPELIKRRDRHILVLYGA